MVGGGGRKRGRGVEEEGIERRESVSYKRIIIFLYPIVHWGDDLFRHGLKLLFFFLQ